MPCTVVRTIFSQSSFDPVVISPSTITMLSLHAVSHATLLLGSTFKHASSTASETWSQSLSGWPSFTDSELKRKVCSVFALFAAGPSVVAMIELCGVACKEQVQVNDSLYASK